MSDKKISELQEVTVLDHNKDYVLAARDEDNYKIKVGNIIKESRIGIPTKLSQLINDMKYISTIPDEYITKAELDIKGYLTEQDLTDYAKKSDIKTVVSQIIDSEGYITEDELDAKNYLTEQDLADYALKTDIPSKVSELINDSGYITESELDAKNYLTEQDLTNYALKTDIPSKVSELINDSGYITEDELDAKNYLTEHQDLTNYALKTDIPTVPTKVSELINDSGYITEIPEDYATKDYVDDKVTNIDISDATINLTGYAKLTDIPTNVSAFYNDEGYITSIPSEYITESELLGYDYATESYVNTKIAEAELGGEDYSIDLSSYVTEDELAAMGYTTLGEASATFATNETVLDLENNLETNYSTTTQMNSAIQQSANSIKTTVSETYATNTSVTDLSTNLTTNYSTTTQMNSAIQQSASNITSTVSSTYATKDELNGLSNTYVTQTEFEQTANKFNWIVKSGTSQSNMTLTDEMYSLISDNITLSADRIDLHGYVTANGNFKIDTSGNMEAKDGTFVGVIKSTSTSDNKYAQMKTSDFGVYNDSTKVISLGLRDITSSADYEGTSDLPTFQPYIWVDMV